MCLDSLGFAGLTIHPMSCGSEARLRLSRVTQQCVFNLTAMFVGTHPQRLNLSLWA